MGQSDKNKSAKNESKYLNWNKLYIGRRSTLLVLKNFQFIIILTLSGLIKQTTIWSFGDLAYFMTIWSSG